MDWSCRYRISSENTWQQTRYFNVDFDSNESLFFFLDFQDYLQFRKKQKHLLRKIFGVLTGSTYWGIALQTTECS